MLKLKHKIAKQTNTSIFKLGNIPLISSYNPNKKATLPMIPKII